MKTMQKLLYSTAMALTVCLAAGSELLAQTNDEEKPILTNTQSGDEVMTDKNNNQKEDSLWEATKEGTEKAWEKTKEISSDAWNTTKESSAKAWEKTKEVSSDAWDATKEGLVKAKNALTD